MSRELVSKAVRLLRATSVKVVQNWKFLFAFFIILIFLNFFFLQTNLREMDLAISQDPILKAYKVEGQAFYQRADSKKWYILSGEEQISSGLQIQTYDDSRMILLFINNPSRLEIAENSLFSISETEKEIIIDFKKGELFVNSQKNFSDKKIILKVGLKFFVLESTDVFVRGYSAGGFEIQVDYGKLTMQQDEKVSTFTKGQVIVFKNSRDYTVQESDVQFSTPFNFDRYFVEASDVVDVRFAWTAPQRLSYAQIYIGEKPSEMKPFYSKPTRLVKSEFLLSLGKGTYYWRLALYDDPKKAAVTVTKLQKFFVEPLIRIQPIYPEANSELPMLSDKTNVQFQWDNPSQLEKVFIEVAEDKNFSKLVIHEAILNKNYFFSDFNSEGEFYWRVNGFPFKSAELMTGVARKFKISKNPKKNPIQIIFPSQGVTLTQNMLKNSDVVLEWNSSIKVNRFKVTVEGPKERKSKSKTFEYSVEGHQLKVNQLESGTYSWSVQALGGAKSEVAEFKVIKTQEIDLMQGSNGKTLVWDKAPKGFESYRLDVLRVGSENSLNLFFSNKKGSKQSFQLKKESFDMARFSEGIYVFKVYALDSKKKIIADSNIRFVKID